MNVSLPTASHLATFHPSAMGAVSIPPTLPIIIAGMLVALFLVGMALRGGAFLNRRHGEMSALAARHSLQSWPSESLPRGLSLEGTHFHQPSKFSNVYHGIIKQREIVILDIEKQEAKSNWSRTILAIRTRDRISAPPSLEAHQAGQWKLIYSPVGISNSLSLMQVDEIESLIHNIVH